MIVPPASLASSFQTATTGNRRFFASAAAWICAIVLLATATGCRSVEVAVLAAADSSAKTVLVLPLDDRAPPSAVADYTIFGMTGGQASGPLICRPLANALKREQILQPLERQALYARMHQRKLRMEEVAILPAPDAIELAREAKADVVVIGEVHEYHTKWLLFLAWTRISFTVRALDTTSQEELWVASFRDTKIFGKDTRMLKAAARDIAAQLKAAFSAPSTPSRGPAREPAQARP